MTNLLKRCVCWRMRINSLKTNSSACMAWIQKSFFLSSSFLQSNLKRWSFRIASLQVDCKEKETKYLISMKSAESCSLRKNKERFKMRSLLTTWTQRTDCWKRCSQRETRRWKKWKRGISSWLPYWSDTMRSLKRWKNSIRSKFLSLKSTRRCSKENPRRLTQRHLMDESLFLWVCWRNTRSNLKKWMMRASPEQMTSSS